MALDPGVQVQWGKSLSDVTESLLWWLTPVMLALGGLRNDAFQTCLCYGETKAVAELGTKPELRKEPMPTTRNCDIKQS